MQLYQPPTTNVKMCRAVMRRDEGKNGESSGWANQTAGSRWWRTGEAALTVKLCSQTNPSVRALLDKTLQVLKDSCVRTNVCLTCGWCCQRGNVLKLSFLYLWSHQSGFSVALSSQPYRWFYLHSGSCFLLFGVQTINQSKDVKGS